MNPERLDRVLQSEVYSDWVTWIGPKLDRFGLDVITVLDEENNEGVYVVVDKKQQVNPEYPDLNHECLTKIGFRLGSSQEEKPPTYIEMDTYQLLIRSNRHVRAAALAFTFTHRKFVSSLLFSEEGSTALSLEEIKKLYDDSFEQFDKKGFNFKEWVDENLS